MYTYVSINGHILYILKYQTVYLTFNVKKLGGFYCYFQVLHNNIILKDHLCYIENKLMFKSNNETKKLTGRNNY